MQARFEAIVQFLPTYLVIVAVLVLPWYYLLRSSIGGHALGNSQLSGTLLTINPLRLFTPFYLLRSPMLWLQHRSQWVTPRLQMEMHPHLRGRMRPWPQLRLQMRLRMWPKHDQKANRTTPKIL